jgi:hypothetical protein
VVMPCLLQVAGELFLSIVAALPDGTHLSGAHILPMRPGATRDGSLRALSRWPHRNRLSGLAHERIIPLRTPGKKDMGQARTETAPTHKRGGGCGASETSPDP